MHTIQPALAALGALVLVSACAQAPKVDAAAEAQAIRDRSAEWLSLAQARDATAIANGVYTADAATLFDGVIRKGTADIQAGMTAEFAGAPDSTITWTTDDVKVAASGDLAYERGSFTFDPDGAGEAAPRTGEFVTIWTKVDGSWRAVVDAGTARKAEEPAAEAVPAAG
jgi:uncharacterized protein (TIGR02246 family)